MSASTTDFYADIKNDFEFHPRKRCALAPTRNWNGNPMPSELWQVYEYHYSDAKRAAYNYCKQLCAKYNGWDFCITSFNTFCFSVAFNFANPQTGEIMTARITKDHNHAYIAETK